jgi:hypothetical protein
MSVPSVVSPNLAAAGKEAVVLYRHVLRQLPGILDGYRIYTDLKSVRKVIKSEFRMNAGLTSPAVRATAPSPTLSVVIYANVTLSLSWRLQAVDHLVENGYQELNESIKRIKTRTHIQRYTVDKLSTKPKPQIQIPADYKKQRDPAFLDWLKQRGLDSPVYLKILDDEDAALENAKKHGVLAATASEELFDSPLAQQYTWEHLVKGPGYDAAKLYQGHRKFRPLSADELN